MNRYLKACILIFSVLWGIDAGSQDYPKEYFDLPVDRRAYLSGTFGELRPDHFHAGIDIKALNGRPGEKIFAAAGGYIARIAVLPGGYGNALYISHPNGYTTVYTHLDRFIPEVADYVKKRQYEARKFKVNLYPRADQFVITKGQLIGYLGNSGNSFGPHLHFEIRRSADQAPVNPFHFGVGVTDNIPPVITHLRVYYLDGDYNVFKTRDYTTEEVAAGKYILTDALVEGAWRVGIAVLAYDKMESAPNNNGVYKVNMSVDGVSQFAFKMDEVSFSTTRYINAHMDYGAATMGPGLMHRCFKLEGNALDMYEEGPDRGYISLFESEPRRVNIEISDFNGNVSTLEFDILRDQEMSAPGTPSGEKCLPNSSLTLSSEGFRFEIPAGSVYTLSYFDVKTAPPPSDSWVGELYDIGSSDIALHKYCDLSIGAPGLPEDLQSKAFIARISDDEDNEVQSYGGVFSGGQLRTSTRSCGTYGIMVDTVPPAVKPVTFSNNMTDYQFMRFEITDNIETSGRARSLQYNATVDGKWILMEYDAKNDIITHWFDEKIPPGKHNLRITVQDDRLNSTIFEQVFTR